MNDNPHIGESLESFLRDEGICEEVTAEAVRRVGQLKIEREAVEQPQKGVYSEAHKE